MYRGSNMMSIEYWEMGVVLYSYVYTNLYLLQVKKQIGRKNNNLSFMHQNADYNIIQSLYDTYTLYLYHKYVHLLVMFCFIQLQDR